MYVIDILTGLSYFVECNSKEYWVDLNIGNIKLNHYEISDRGNIRIKSTKQIRKQHMHGIYKCIVLWTNHKTFKTFSVHRLVAETFIEKSADKNIVCHKDTNSFNNFKSNLIWGTQKENIYQSRELNKYHDYGENSVNSVYKEDFIRKLCILLKDKTKTQKMILQTLNLPLEDKYYSLLRHLKNKTRWKHIAQEYME
jgi:hypothetical protein